jgi:hypothetical protein
MVLYDDKIEQKIKQNVKQQICCAEGKKKC